MPSRYIVTHGEEEGFHITVARAFSKPGFEVVIWRGDHGTGGLGVIRGEFKAKEIAKYLYDNLADEYEAERVRQKAEYQKFEAEQAKRPKPEPPTIPKNAPKIDVLECSECNHLIPPDEVSDERVYECGECGTVGAGEDARRCDQCNKFTAKTSDTSCPECSAAMDEAETVQAQRATNGELIKVDSPEERAARKG